MRNFRCIVKEKGYVLGLVYEDLKYIIVSFKINYKLTNLYSCNLNIYLFIFKLNFFYDNL